MFLAPSLSTFLASELDRRFACAPYGAVYSHCLRNNFGMTIFSPKLSILIKIKLRTCKTIKHVAVNIYIFLNYIYANMNPYYSSKDSTVYHNVRNSVNYVVHENSSKLLRLN